MYEPGLVVLFGSGEISPSGRQVYHWLFDVLDGPIRPAILETPAGFEPNSEWVARQVADFIQERLQNFSPQVTVVPARRRGTEFSPDEPQIVTPILSSNVIFIGPGSPTYAVRQLRDSLAWYMLTARHRLGGAVILASAATLAISAYTLPVYEIYKVGEDLHWQAGLDFFGPFGLSLVFVPHWNNQDGGAHLDTSRCYMGRARFAQLLARLPAEVTVVGIDEHTALIVDLTTEICRLMGRGGVTLLRRGEATHFDSGQSFRLAELGPFCRPDMSAGVPPHIWQQARAVQVQSPSRKRASLQPSDQVLTLVEERQAARARCDWAAADALRDRIGELGWHIRDTSNGPELIPGHSGGAKFE
jgi:hypothetical protein